MILPLGQFVLTEALNAAVQWQSLSTNKLEIAVNLSPTQFRGPNLVEFIKEAINASGLKAEMLKFEISKILQNKASS